ncbi:MAG: hypothetical protein ACOYOJ_08785 [Alsobacter sp.]
MSESEFNRHLAIIRQRLGADRTTEADVMAAASEALLIQGDVEAFRTRLDASVTPHRLAELLRRDTASDG